MVIVRTMYFSYLNLSFSLDSIDQLLWEPDFQWSIGMDEFQFSSYLIDRIEIGFNNVKITYMYFLIAKTSPVILLVKLIEQIKQRNYFITFSLEHKLLFNINFTNNELRSTIINDENSEMMLTLIKRFKLIYVHIWILFIILYLWS